jgi:hypothetical protein
MVIWRPFVDVEQSVNTLATGLLYRQCLQEVPKLLYLYAARLNLLSSKSLTSSVDPILVDFYWNNGKPLVKDLVDFFLYGLERWRTEEGEGTPQRLRTLITALQGLPYYEQETLWTDKMARVHRYVMLDIHFFWYKRFFREEEEWKRKICDHSLYEDWKPRTLSKTAAYKESLKREIEA